MTIFIIILTTLFFLLLIYSFYFFLKLYYKRNQDFMAELQAVNFENEKNLLSMQIEVQEQTFENISREIHDNIGQKLSVAKLHLSTVGSLPDPKQRDKLLAAIKLISSTIVDLGDISRTMNTDFISHYGLCKVIELEIQQLRKLCRYTINFEVKGEKVFLSPQKELITFRVIQEALNNIIKHAECNIISIQLRYEPDMLVLNIFDNGKGYETVSSGYSFGTGIHNMKKRTGIIGADLQIESILNKGTSIIMKIPYDKKA